MKKNITMNFSCNKSYAYITITILLWGSSASVIKLLLSNLEKDLLLLSTIFFATISLFVIALFQNKLKFIKQLRTKDYLIFSFMGFIGVYIYYKLFYLALLTTSTQVAFIMNYTWALWIIVFSFFVLKETFSKKKILGILIGIIGVAFVLSKDKFDVHLINYEGILYALFGAICYGLFSVLTKKLKYDKIISIFFYYFFSLIFISIDTFLSKETINFSFSFNELIGVLYIGIACSGLGFVFWTKALEYGETNIMSNLILLIPFVALVYIYFLLHEPIFISSIFGLLLIVSGVMIQNIKIKGVRYADVS